MGILGARPKGRPQETTGSTSELPVGRLDQLMTFVEKAATPAPPAVVPDLPPRLVPTVRAVVAQPSAERPVAAEAAPATPVRAPSPTLDRPSVMFPEPILIEPQRSAGAHAAPIMVEQPVRIPVAGKRRLVPAATA